MPDGHIRAALGPGTDRYCAMLCSPIGAANGALLVQYVIDHLLRDVPDRFVYADHSKVEHVALHENHAVLTANGHTVHAERVVLCTNGFLDHVLDNLVGESLAHTMHHQLIGTKGYMTGVAEPGLRAPNAYSFIRNEQIGDDETPYLYVTRRPWDDAQMLVVFGGPEEELDDASTYDADDGFPAWVVDEFETDVTPLAYPAHGTGRAVRLPLARTDGVHDESVAAHRSRTTQPGAALQPGLQRGGVHAEHLRRPPHRPSPGRRRPGTEHLRPTRLIGAPARPEGRVTS